MANYFTGLMDDPQFRMGIGLLGAAGPMPANVGFGQRLGMAANSFDEWRNAERRMKILEAEEKRREEDSEATRKYRDVQMKQLQQEMEDKALRRGLEANLMQRFAAQQAALTQPPVPSMPAGPLNPEMSILDANMLAGNHAQSMAADRAARASATQFPMSPMEVAQYALRGIDVTKLADWWRDREKLEPGKTYVNRFGEREEVPMVDAATGMTYTSKGAQRLPNAADIQTEMKQRLIDAERRGAAPWTLQEQVIDGRIVNAPQSHIPGIGTWPGGAQPPAPGAPQQPAPAPAQAAPRPSVPAGAPQGQMTDRRRIIADEMLIEQRRLAELQSLDEPNYRLRYGANAEPRQTQIERTQNNLASLQREQALLGGQAAPQGAPAPAPGQPPRPGAPAAPAAVPPVGAVSPKDLELQQQQARARGAVRDAAGAALQSKTLIDDLTNMVGITSTGFVGNKMREWIGPGTDAYNLGANIKTLQARLAFGELQKMRDLSKTGGALGNVSEKELDLLMSAVSQLDPNQSGDLLRANLRKVKEHYDRWLDLVVRGHMDTYGQLPPDLAQFVAGAATGGGASQGASYLDAARRNR